MAQHSFLFFTVLQLNFPSMPSLYDLNFSMKKLSKIFFQFENWTSKCLHYFMLECIPAINSKILNTRLKTRHHYLIFYLIFLNNMCSSVICSFQARINNFTLYILIRIRAALRKLPAIHILFTLRVFLLQ